ncbi:unnamed protein product [Paramecium sonneborni]|uniref:Uncharacterized protein n=1 Tax=Paramecium sonneborni TaxID=65129 RepID=A0A8S1JYN3_9CILI|nr:unnamed protein product [Paramecium sonneborni]
MSSDYLIDLESSNEYSQNIEENNKKNQQNLSLFRSDSFFIDFEQQSTIIVNPVQEYNKEINNKKVGRKKLDKKIKKQSKDRNLNDYKKNICRNILRHAIKSMINDQDCIAYISELVDDSKQLSIYYNRQLELITGYRVLRDQLIQLKDDDLLVRNRKQAFKQYLLWYLKTKATAMILRGESQNPEEYLRYKNEVLMYYIHQPHEWMSNNPQWLNGSTTTMNRQFQVNSDEEYI